MSKEVLNMIPVFAANGSYLVYYLFIMNVLGIGVMGVDKLKARRNAFRIPERILFLVSLLGGSVGTLVGMYLFRHKTKHWYFVIGMPMILCIQVGIWFLIYQ